MRLAAIVAAGLMVVVPVQVNEKAYQMLIAFMMRDRCSDVQYKIKIENFYFLINVEFCCIRLLQC